MPRIGIIGSGFGAIAVAAELLRHGHRDIRLWERADGIGGVWRDNTYPGAACDVPSPFSSFSWAPSAQWPRRYAEQPDILRYLRTVAAREGIAARTRTRVAVREARWTGAAWEVTLSSGERAEVDVLIPAVGQLSNPVIPRIPGADSFRGEAFHTAQWPDALDVAGRRVAVIGAAATAVQLVPALAGRAAHVTAFQRTPSYIWPKPDGRYPRFYRRLAARIERPFFLGLGEPFSRQISPGSIAARVGAAVTRAHLRLRVRDRALRRVLTPEDPIGCRRILFSNTFYPALVRDDVSLVTAGIERIEPDAVVTTDGARHPVDVIAYATGFDTQAFLRGIRVIGREGADLHEQWAAGARAYLGMHVPGFPNLLLCYGPNTNLGGSSIVRMLEAQAHHMRLVLDHLVTGAHGAVEVSAEAEERWDADIQQRLLASAWTDCDSWYRHPVSGRITSNWPGGTAGYVARTRRLRAEDFVWE